MIIEPNQNTAAMTTKLNDLNRSEKPGRYLLSLFFILPLLFISCQDIREQTVTWEEFEPVYMSHEAFMNSVELKDSRDLERPGKIYFYDGYLFVNEVNEGIHIIDNSNPSSPHNIGFINIPGNKDISIRNSLLYADSQKDLLVFDIQNLESPELIHRLNDVFSKSANRPPGFTTQTVDPSKGLVVDWKLVQRREVCEGNCASHPASGSPTFRTLASSDSGFNSTVGESQTGVGGSMARFTITGEHLYAIDERDLYTFDISKSSAVKVNQQYVGWLIETIFPYNNHLFVGSVNSMYIYSLSNPNSPEQLSVFRHATACDPIVVENDYAYVTLRDGPNCPNISGTNHLEVIDVSDLFNPKMVGKYGMINPHGLGIDNGTLFVSEGDYGLKVFDAGNPLDVKQIRHIVDIKTFDVIPHNNVLMVTGKSGIVQYDYTDVNNITHLSTIHVVEQ